MQFVALHCIRCRGRAYADDDVLVCANCGRLLAVRAPRRFPFRTVRIEHQKKGKADPHSLELKAICLQWLMEGESTEDIASVSGVRQSTLKIWRRKERARLGLPALGRPQYEPEFKMACAARMLAGETLEALSEETGIKVATLREWRLNARRGI